MSFLDRIAECNRHELAHFRPFHVDAQPIGWIRHGLASRLAGFPEIFRVADDHVGLNPELRGFGPRSRAIARVVRALERESLIAKRRREMYPALLHVGGPPLFKLDRVAVPAFGLRSCGVHMTGFVRAEAGLAIWVPRRARDRTYPGMLDNTVAGGQPIGLGILANLEKECGEEASIPRELARRVVPVGSIGYCLEAEEGLKPDVQFCFDLELPAEFTPLPGDGEVEGFELWPVERVMATVRETREFKFNCSLVLIDFFLRHGLIGRDHPDHDALVFGLRRDFPHSAVAAKAASR